MHVSVIMSTKHGQTWPRNKDTGACAVMSHVQAVYSNLQSSSSSVIMRNQPERKLEIIVEFFKDRRVVHEIWLSRHKQEILEKLQCEGLAAVSGLSVCGCGWSWTWDSCLVLDAGMNKLSS